MVKKVDFHIFQKSDLCVTLSLSISTSAGQWRLVSVPGEVGSLWPTSVMLCWQPPSPAPVMRSKYANKEKRLSPKYYHHLTLSFLYKTFYCINVFQMPRPYKMDWTISRIKNPFSFVLISKLENKIQILKCLQIFYFVGRE